MSSDFHENARRQLCRRLLDDPQVSSQPRSNPCWIEQFERDGDFIILGTESRVWFAAAVDEQRLWELRELIRAFIGPTYGLVVESVGQHPPPSFLEDLQTVAPSVVCFHGDRRFEKEIGEAVQRACELRRRAQKSTISLGTSLQTALRNFYMAVRAGRRSAAESELETLRDVHCLSAANISNLRVQMLSEFGRWRELVGLQELETLTQTPRPPLVARAVLRAFCEERLLPYEPQGLFDVARTVFETDVAPRIGQLLRTRSARTDPYTLRMFAYAAVVDGDRRRLDDILSEAPDTDDVQAALAGIAALLAPDDAATTEPAVDHETATALYNQGDVDGALKLAETMPASRQRTILLLNCAFAVQSLESIRLALDSVDQLDPDDARELRAHPTWKRMLTDLDLTANALAVEVPQNWSEWFERLSAPDAVNLIDVAAQGAEEWNPLELDASAMAGSLRTTWTGGAYVAVRCSIPHVWRFLQRADDFPSRQHAPVYAALLDLLIYEIDGNRSDLDVMSELLRARLETGIKAADYAQLLDDLTAVWDVVKSPERISWWVDILEVLADEPCPDEEARSRVLWTWPTITPRLLQRLGDADWQILSAICDQVETVGVIEACLNLVPESAETDDVPDDEWQQLSGMTVGAYTLTVPAGHRFRDFLMDRCPDCTVVLNHDHVATEALENMARSCDVLVVVKRSAQHAATDAIMRCRRDSPTLNPPGKGSASMIRVLQDYLNNELVTA